MTRTLLISERAEADLRAIWRWTCDTFGETQADRYLDQLRDGMARCRSAPEDGKDRSDLRPGYRSVLLRKHVVFYTYTPDAVLIQRVLHSSMDFGSHLPEN